MVALFISVICLFLFVAWTYGAYSIKQQDGFRQLREGLDADPSIVPPSELPPTVSTVQLPPPPPPPTSSVAPTAPILKSGPPTDTAVKPGMEQPPSSSSHWVSALSADLSQRIEAANATANNAVLVATTTQGKVDTQLADVQRSFPSVDALQTQLTTSVNELRQYVDEKQVGLTTLIETNGTSIVNQLNQQLKARDSSQTKDFNDIVDKKLQSLKDLANRVTALESKTRVFEVGEKGDTTFTGKVMLKQPLGSADPAMGFPYVTNKKMYYGDGIGIGKYMFK